jgi:hypothetical protein
VADSAAGSSAFWEVPMRDWHRDLLQMEAQQRSQVQKHFHWH